METTLLCILLIAMTTGADSQTVACGQAALSPRIVGGQEASPGSWPWMVAMFVDSDFVCGGALIMDQWVLTTAHCIFPYYYPPSVPEAFRENFTIQLFLGRHNFSDPNPNQEEREATQLLLHPQYNDGDQSHDIGLLKLHQPVSFNQYIQPVCVAAGGSVLHSGDMAWVAGWGVTEERGSVPSALQEVSVPIVGDNQCQCSIPTFLPESDTLCAGHSEGGKDSCQGDSGGPLVVKEGGAWVAVGVVSTGVGCARANAPGVYSQVSLYQDWIQNQTSLKDDSFVTVKATGQDPDLGFSCTPTTTTDTTTPTTATTTPTTTTDTSTPTTAPGPTADTFPTTVDKNSIFDNGEKIAAHLSQLLYLCGLAMSLYVLG